MITKAMEDYLKAIYQMETEQGAVTNTNLATALGVVPASVTGMLKKLAALDLVAYTRYQGVTLTPHGREIALRMVRYHRLAERYLAEVLGLPWDQVHAEAEELEHALSERVVGRMDALMGSPVTDPHGESIPGPTGRMPERHDIPLSTLAAGEAATVARVKPTDPELLRYLGDLGIYPQVTLTVEAVAPFDGPVTVSVAGQRHAIGLAVAAQIFVADVHAVEVG